MDEVKINELLKLIEENSDQDAISKLIEYYKTINDYEQLKALYELIVKVNPNDSDSLFELALFYEEEEQYEKAKSLYRRLLDLNPQNSFYHLQYGEFLEYDLQDNELAKTYYLKAIELDALNVDAYLNLSWLYLEKFNDIHTSYIVVCEALKYVVHSNIYTQIGYIELMKYKEYQKSEKNLQKAIELDKKNDLAYTYLGQLYLYEKNFDLAKETFSQAVQLGLLNDLLIYEYGKLLILHYKDFNGAIALLEKAIEVYPHSIIYYGYLANLHFVLGNINESKKYLHMAEAFEIEDQEALLMIGYLKVMLDDNKEEALMYFEKVIELNPTNLNALSFIGFYNLMNNQHIDTALTYFKKIADLSKDNFIIHFIISQIYLQYYHDSTQALEYLLKIKTESLNQTELSHLYFVIGNIYENYVHNNHLALDYYEQAYQIKPEKFLEEVINRIYDKDKTIVN